MQITIPKLKNSKNYGEMNIKLAQILPSKVISQIQISFFHHIL